MTVTTKTELIQAIKSYIGKGVIYDLKISGNNDYSIEKATGKVQVEDLHVNISFYVKNKEE